MGKIILILGENGSGKSRFAEKAASRLGKKLCYLATMNPQTEENFARIEKHKMQREKYGFTTLEVPYSVAEADISGEDVILIEDVSNLLANNFFEKNKNEDYVFKDIVKAAEKSRAAVVVSISGLDGSKYEGETAEYTDKLNRINAMLYERACTVAVMSEGKVIYKKGEKVW